MTVRWKLSGLYEAESQLWTQNTPPLSDCDKGGRCESGLRHRLPKFTCYSMFRHVGTIYFITSNYRQQGESRAFCLLTQTFSLTDSRNFYKREALNCIPCVEAFAC